MTTVYVGLGSNLGDRRQMITSAVEMLRWLSDTRVLRLSSIRETEPVGGPPQGRYLNAVAELKTLLSSSQLLTSFGAIERSLGRAPSDIRWGPRTVDLDILFYGSSMIAEDSLVVPHPHIWERSFVLEPLAELRPDLVAAGTDGWQQVMVAGSLSDAAMAIEEEVSRTVRQMTAG